MSKITVGTKFGLWEVSNHEYLGAGGNGKVWPVHRADGVSGALKILHAKHLENPNDGLGKRRTSRFFQEIRFLKTSNNLDGILPAIDSYTPEYPSLHDRPWLVTPIAVPLSKAPRTTFPVLDSVVEVFAAIAKTLARLHTEGVHHRDIKPENLFLLSEKPVIGDFGLVELPDGADLTGKSEFMGPLFYIAPEMMQNADGVDAAPADVYSLIKSFWVIATDQNYPPPGEQRIDTPALVLSTYRKHCDAEILDHLIYQCTRHNPSDRPSMQYVATELSAWTRRVSTSGNLPSMVGLGVRINTATVHLDDSIARRQRIQKSLEKLCSDARVRFEQQYATIAKDLEVERGGVTEDSSSWQSYLYETRNPRPWPWWMRSVTASVVFPSKQSQDAIYPETCLQSGLGFMWQPTQDTVLVSACHSIYTNKTNGTEWTTVWINEIQAPVLTAQLAKVVIELEGKLWENSRRAVEAFTEMIEQIYKT
jgi:serine/threonine protein kinase